MRGAEDGDVNPNTDGAQSSDEDVRNIMSQSQSNDAPIASYGSSSSNNVLNSNLSGSMKRFNLNQRPRNSDDSDEDEETNVSRYHECFEPNQSIFAPISSSQPIGNPYEAQTASGPSSHQRIAVAALPNLEFDQFSRGFSASSPSLNSQHGSNSRRNSNGSDQRRADFARNATASSSNYFV